VLDAMTLDVDGEYDVIALTGSLPVYDARFERALRWADDCLRSWVPVRSWTPGCHARGSRRMDERKACSRRSWIHCCMPLTPPRFVF
jgi:hypothetical protein